MPLPSSPSSTRLKILAMLAVSGGLLYAGHAWLNVSSDLPDASTSSRASSALSGTPQPAKLGTSPGAGKLISAQEVTQAYARAPQDANARFKGQRLRLQGVVRQTEAGQGQVLLITLGTDEDQPGLRAVLDLGAHADGTPPPAVGQRLTLDCLNQGLLMGEPVWSDCRLQP